jgi:hypothetical protein
MSAASSPTNLAREAFGVIPFFNCELLLGVVVVEVVEPEEALAVPLLDDLLLTYDFRGLAGALSSSL